MKLFIGGPDLISPFKEIPEFYSGSPFKLDDLGICSPFRRKKKIF